MARQRGGYRQPANPAPVSGPGATSQRTDGGPADRQPMRVASGGAYGSRQAVESQQAAAPMHQATSGAPPPGAGPGAAAPPSVFGPSDYPGEPITAGVNVGAGPGAPQVGQPDDPDLILQILWSIYPHPEIARLMISGNQPTRATDGY